MTRVIIKLTDRELEKLDAYVDRRNRQIIGRKVTRSTEARRMVLEEIGIVDRHPEAFWSGVGKGGPTRIDPND